MSHLLEILNSHVYTVIFIALFLELIALPLPGELLMSYCGYLVFQHKINFILCIIAASIGAMIGITLSYFIGSIVGNNILNKFKPSNNKKFAKTTSWFNKYGDKLLLFAYYLPGIRHITGYFSGITKISFLKFSLYAYLGAILWSATFISLGNMLGSSWNTVDTESKSYLLIGGLLFLSVIFLSYFYNIFNKQKFDSTHKNKL